MSEALSVVTSCHGYGQYLNDWAESLIHQEVRPAFIGIFTHGSEEDRAAGQAAFVKLDLKGLPVQWIHEPERLDFGAARNRAVAMNRGVKTPWVMHLDADDTLMPHAVGDVTALFDQADVIPLGYERTGDLAAGPKLKVKLYRASHGPTSLANPTPASGCSPFRRSFWEQAPYRTDLIGGWDTALWLGFAHLGARFVPTTRPGFWYRQHADSLFNTRRKSGWPAVRAGVKLQALRAGMAGVDIIVPRDREPDGYRNAAWTWLRRRYEALFPDWGIRVGTGERKVWRKGAAIDHAIRESTAEVVVISDADCIVPRDALQNAVRLVQSGEAAWVMPHGMVYRLSDTTTDHLLTKDPTITVEAIDLHPSRLHRPPYVGSQGGGVLVVGRAEYLATRGIPKVFVGWGAEDEALAVILDTLLGPHTRFTDIPLVHLWHPHQRSENRQAQVAQSEKNRLIFERYLRARGDQAKMWALVSGEVSPHLGPYFDSVTRHRTADVRSQAIRDEVTARRAPTDPRELRKAQMAGALENARAYRLKRQEQRARNEEANRARAEAKAMMKTPQHKAMTGPTPVKFASVQAEQLAKEAGLVAADFNGIETGPKGITKAMVEALITGNDSTDEESGDDAE